MSRCEDELLLMPPGTLDPFEVSRLLCRQFDGSTPDKQTHDGLSEVGKGALTRSRTRAGRHPSGRVFLASSGSIGRGAVRYLSPRNCTEYARLIEAWNDPPDLGRRRMRSDGRAQAKPRLLDVAENISGTCLGVPGRWRNGRNWGGTRSNLDIWG